MAHRGKKLEDQIKTKFKRMGWTRLQRSYASLGIWDIMAFRKIQVMSADFKTQVFTEVLEIQVKGTKYEFKDADKLALKEHAEQIGARGCYVYRDRKKGEKRGNIVVEYL